MTVEITSMPASSSSSTSCHRFSLREPGHVGVGELVDQRDLGRAGDAPRRRPSPRTSAPRYVDRAAGHDLEVARSAPRCSARPWVSTNPTTTSVPRLARRRALVEHREGLADAGRGAEVDAERAARHASKPTGRHCGTIADRGRRLSSSTFDRLLAEDAERPVRRVVVDQRAAPSRRGSPRSSATRARLQPRVGHRDVGVEPGARRGHRVDRHLRRRRRGR